MTTVTITLTFRATGAVPSGLSPGLNRFLQAIKENQDILIGHRKRGGTRSRSVRFQDLIDLGLITEEDLPDD